MRSIRAVPESLNDIDDRRLAVTPKPQTSARFVREMPWSLLNAQFEAVQLRGGLRE